MADATDETVLIRYSRLWTALAILFLLGAGSELTFLGEQASLSSSWDVYFKSLGASVIASVIVYALVTLLVEPKRSSVAARATTRYAISQALSHFQERFDVSLPTAVFESSSVPKADFRAAFAKELETTTRYEHKGTSGTFASYRIVTLARRSEFRRIEDIRLYLLDPREEEIGRAHAAHQLAQAGGEPPTEAQIAASAANSRLKTFVTLAALYGARNLVSTRVYFHRDLPFFRAELMDSGLFLTYYVGNAAFPETLQFGPATRPYAAYRGAIEITRRYATRLAIFTIEAGSKDAVRNEAGLVELLAELGCTQSPTELDQLVNARVHGLNERMGQGGVSIAGLF